jgi:hypothetical protein
MKQEIQITKGCSSIEKNYTVTQCINGYLVDLNGRDSKDEWINVKYVVLNLSDLNDVVEHLDNKIKELPNI